MPQNALQNILTEAGVAVSPLKSIDTSDKAITFFRQLGYEFPPGSFGSALAGTATQGSELVTAVQQLMNAHTDEEIAGALVSLMSKLVATIDAIRQLANQVQSGP